MPRTVPRSAADLARHMLAAFPQLDEFEQRLSLALYRELARGEPVTDGALAARVGADAREVARRLERWPAVRRDGQSRVIGYWGLTIVPTRHSLSIGARTLYGWCAWDTLFLPALLGESAQVRSVCRASGAPVRLTVAPDALRAADPGKLFLSFVLPEAGALREDVTTAFCRFVHFYASPSRPEDPGLPGAAFFLTLEEAFEAGRLRNRGRYRDSAAFERGGRDET